MPKISETYPLGDIKDIDTATLARILADMYRDLAKAINKKPDVITRDSDGIATEVFLSDGTININSTSNKVEVLTNHTSSTAVTWTTVS